MAKNGLTGLYGLKSYAKALLLPLGIAQVSEPIHSLPETSALMLALSRAHQSPPLASS